jgi:heptaprenyl diphosphate synthase
VNVVELLGLPALEDQLKRLEPLLVESVVTGDGFLDEVTTHLLAAGGKRLRPVLALATATSGSGTASREDLHGADAVEHVTVRRNVESVNARFGNLVAIVAGDFLLARSAEIAAGLGTEIAGLLAATLGELCRGQVAEVHAAFQVGRTEDSYSEAIAGKTASLMATSCRIGALTGGLPREQVEAFTSFGRYFGMIFQVRDDILDVIGTEAELGKPAGQDLAEGIYTLPVLRALADPAVGPELRPLLGQPLGQPERDKARSIVAESGAIADSVVVARQYAELAAEAAVAGPSARLAEGFAGLAHSLVDDLPTG